jgi:murein DD-endopeptidase MepM/ murein hydrolase activator NlpD
MNYTIKPGDTLTKIANKYKLPMASILATNTQIKDADQISVGQVIHIPNMKDIPGDSVFEVPSKPSQLVLRVRSVVNCNVLYKLGRGGMFPGDPLPCRDELCDCSGFVCWVLGLPRKTNIPFYKQFGGWIFTDAMIADIQNTTGILERLQHPEPGCIVVYGAGRYIGHVAMVSEVVNGSMKKVIHCSAGNS